MPPSDSRIAGSSSTISTLSIGGAGRRSRGFRGHWQLNHKASARRVVFLDTNRSVVIFNDPAHDGEAEAGAPLLRRKIWQEQPLFGFLGNTLTAVGHADLNRIAGGNEGGRNFDLLHHGSLY